MCSIEFHVLPKWVDCSGLGKFPFIFVVVFFFFLTCSPNIGLNWRGLRRGCEVKVFPYVFWECWAWSWKAPWDLSWVPPNSEKHVNESLQTQLLQSLGFFHSSQESCASSVFKATGIHSGSICNGFLHHCASGLQFLQNKPSHPYDEPAITPWS